MEAFSIERTLATVALGVSGVGLLAWLYFLIGCFVPDFNFRVEKSLRKLFRMPSVIILDYDSYIRRRNRNAMFLIQVGWVTVLIAAMVIIALISGK